MRSPQQIGAAVRSRRLALGLSQDQIPGVSAATVRKIEKGTEPNPTDRVRANLARGLRWGQDAYAVLAAGRTPIDADDDAVVRGWLSQFSPRLLAILGSDDPAAALGAAFDAGEGDGLDVELAALSAILRTLERIMQETNQAASAVPPRPPLPNP